MVAKYKKAKKWIGKDLTLYVGGGDKRIFDHHTYEGPAYERFVGLGFMERIPETVTPAATVGVSTSIAMTEAISVAQVETPVPASSGSVTRTKVPTVEPKRRGRPPRAEASNPQESTTESTDSSEVGETTNEE